MRARAPDSDRCSIVGYCDGQAVFEDDEVCRCVVDNSQEVSAWFRGFDTRSMSIAPECTKSEAFVCVGENRKRYERLTRQSAGPEGWEREIPKVIRAVEAIYSGGMRR